MWSRWMCVCVGGSNLCRIFRASSLLRSMPSSARLCWISEASMRPSHDIKQLHYNVHQHIQWTCDLSARASHSLPTIVVSIQTLKSQPQLLLVLLQVPGELVEVQTPIFVLVTRWHDFLQRGDQVYWFTVTPRHLSHTAEESHAKQAGQDL